MPFLTFVMAEQTLGTGSDPGKMEKPQRFPLCAHFGQVRVGLKHLGYMIFLCEHPVSRVTCSKKHT